MPRSAPDALEIPDQQRPKVNPRRQRRTPVLLGIKLRAPGLDKLVEALGSPPARRAKLGERFGRRAAGKRLSRRSGGRPPLFSAGCFAFGYSAVTTSHVEPSWLRPRFSIRIRLTAAARWASQILFFSIPM